MEKKLDGLMNRDNLVKWLDDNVPALGSGALEAQMMPGGSSNVIISLKRGMGELILRRPPATPPPNSEKAILREARVLQALSGTPVPHPKYHGHCEDPAVIGAAFYVMERAPGWAGDLQDGHIYHRAPFDKAPYEYGIAYAMVDGLVALANVDYKAIGLEGFGKPDNFLERQVDRWESQLNSYGELYGYAGRNLPGYAYTRDWLRANLPEGFMAGIIHGDVGTQNALFADGPPARLTALIDWELSTIGDPLLDLAWFCSGLRDDRDPDRVAPGALYNAANFPTRQELASYYAAGTGRDLGVFDYYLMLAKFKFGCIIEYKVAQAAAGILSKEAGELTSVLVLNTFSEAERLGRSLG